MALFDPRDQHYVDAIRVHEALHAAGTPLTTTSLVVAEAHAMIARRRGRELGVRFLEILDERPGQSVVWVDAELMLAGRGNWIARHADKTYSLTDAVSFEVMTRDGIREAFAFDLDFERAGFRLLTARP